MVIQVPQVFRKGHDKRRYKEHMLVVLLQAPQEGLSVLAIGGKIGRDNVHVIAGAHGLFLFLDLGTVKVCDLPLDGLDRLVPVHGMDMQRHENVALHFQKIRKDAIIQFGGVDLKEIGLADYISHAKASAGLKLKGAWSNKVLDREPGGNKPLPVESEGLERPNMENTVQQPEPCLAGQGCCRHAKFLEVAENGNLNTFQFDFCVLVTSGINAKGKILGLNDAVVAESELRHQHAVVFIAHTVELIAGRRNEDSAFQTVGRDAPVEKAQSEVYGAVKVIEESGPAAEDGVLVIRLAQLIVDVLKLDGFGVMLICGPTNAVRPHLQKRDAVLRGLFLAIRAVCSCDGRLNRFPVCAGQRAFGQ